MKKLLFVAAILTFDPLPFSECFQIVGYGTLEINSTLVLASKITLFNGPATWSNRDMTSISTCTSNEFCTTLALENYEFYGNISGTFVKISPLLPKDDNMMWTCYFGNKTEFYTVILKFSTTSSQVTTESFAPTEGMIHIIETGSLEHGSELMLACLIPKFTGFATWGGANIESANCTPSSCSPSSKGRQIFASNTSGIFATINSLSWTDNGTMWMCYHRSYSTSYTVFIRQQAIYVLTPETTGTLSTSEIVAIVISCLAVGIIIVVAIVYKARN